ncbi:hypothetical protein [Streptomyces sp. UG1]|uniref:hypothetical protein n=1 Tax=Streptomyces sp. UG1 TaxID=3417652 RepID=UPI003CF40D76
MYTPGEKLRLAWLTAKAAKSAILYARQGQDDWQPNPRIEREMDCITDRAEKRWERESSAAFAKLAEAEDELTAAKADLRAAKGPEKTAARRRRNDAKDKVRRARAAARRYDPHA